MTWRKKDLADKGPVKKNLNIRKAGEKRAADCWWSLYVAASGSHSILLIIKRPKMLRTELKVFSLGKKLLSEAA
jgi:hypothetical protein